MAWRWRIAQFFELLWWRNYLSGRDAMGYLQWKSAYWRDFLKWADLGGPEPADVLDAGCGPAGIFLVFSSDPQYRVLALDPLLEAYEHRFPHFDRRDYPEVGFVNGSIETLQAENQFDRIFCLNAINHVGDLDRALAVLYRSLRPGGDILLSVDAHRHRLAAVLFRVAPIDILHPHQYTAGGYIRRLRDTGFRIEWVRNFKTGLLFDYTVIRCRK